MKISLCYFIHKGDWPWIAYSLASMRDSVDEVVIWDEKPGHPGLTKGRIITGPGRTVHNIHKPIDVMDQKAYERIFNGMLQDCTGDWIIWLHSDLVAFNGEVLRPEIERVLSVHPDALHMSIRVTSFVRDFKHIWDPRSRTDRWPMIVKNGCGLHYHGAYGHPEEGFYFRDITGDVHDDHWSTKTPYPIHPTELHVAHGCELQPAERRLEKMIKVLKNQGFSDSDALHLANVHPRVNLQPGDGFAIKPYKGPLPAAMQGFPFGNPLEGK